MNLEDVARLARLMKEHSGLSVRKISELMGRPGQQAQTQRIMDLKDPNNTTFKTFLRFAKACDFDVHIYVTPRRNHGKGKAKETKVKGSPS